jgi:hypothetical protein
LLVDEVGEDPWRFRDCFALENMSRARNTPLLRRFFSPLGVASSFAFRFEGLLPPARLSPPLLDSAAGVDVEIFGGSATDVDSTALSSSFPGVDEEPNILFNRPPELEKLLRLFPARLMIVPRCAGRFYGRLVDLLGYVAESGGTVKTVRRQ